MNGFSMAKLQVFIEPRGRTRYDQMHMSPTPSFRQYLGAELFNLTTEPFYR